ncbi:hypothetical protein MRX96_038065 [Rhipicephalus microplus]
MAAAHASLLRLSPPSLITMTSSGLRSNMAVKKPHCPNFESLSSPLGYRSATFPKGNAACKTCPKPGLQIQKRPEIGTTVDPWFHTEGHMNATPLKPFPFFSH